MNVANANTILRSVLTAVLLLWALHAALGVGYWRYLRETLRAETVARTDAQQLLRDRRGVAATAVSNAAQVRDRRGGAS
jgi:hypothetical protein